MISLLKQRKETHFEKLCTVISMDLFYDVTKCHQIAAKFIKITLPLYMLPSLLRLKIFFIFQVPELYFVKNLLSNLRILSVLFWIITINRRQVSTLKSNTNTKICSFAFLARCSSEHTCARKSTAFIYYAIFEQ